MSEDSADRLQILEPQEIELIMDAAVKGAAHRGRTGATEEEILEVLCRCAGIYTMWVYAGRLLIDIDTTTDELVFINNPEHPLFETDCPLADSIEGLLQAKEWGDEPPAPIES